MKSIKQIVFVASIASILSACGDSDSKSAEAVDQQAPVIAAEKQQIMADSSGNTVSISVSDNVTSTEDIQVSVTSLNSTLITDDNLVLYYDSEGVKLTVTPEVDTIGIAMIQITATDDNQNSASMSFEIEVLANQVSSSEMIAELSSIGADQEPKFINSLDIVEDIESDDLLDELFIR